MNQHPTRIGKVQFAVPNFFAIPLRKMEVEVNRYAGATYFLHEGRIIAVAGAIHEEDSE